ncbi:lycopene beta-cyclase [Frigoribacterium sp. PvP054]
MADVQPVAEPTSSRSAGVRDARVPHPRAVGADRLPPRTVDVAVVGGGCSGLAVAGELSRRAPELEVLVLEGRTRPDPRVWCSWDDGSDPVPEARSASWDRWEVRTRAGISTGTDPDHPYRMVRAEDRREAVDRRLAESRVAVVDGAAVHDFDRRAHDGRHVLQTGAGTVEARLVVDATGHDPLPSPQHGAVLLHQRFVGLWISTARPVFDPTTVTLMDFTDAPDDQVRFVYVLPVSPTEALVESTVFTPERRSSIDFRAHVRDYVHRRWGLEPHEWTVTGSESGCVPMTDAAPPRPGGDATIATVAGVVRPSSGYGYARAHRHAPTVVDHLLDGTPAPAFRDTWRTRALDAVFLRFLRDRPDAAPEAFRRLFTLPGPLVVRFLTERSTPRDELRIVLVLPKAPFVAALLRTVRETCVARWRRSACRA